MKFRAKMVDVACLNHLSRVVNTISKLAKSCILRLTADKLYFILSDKVASGGVAMWCQLLQGNFFDEFQIEGVSTDYNEIYLELVPENLSRSLKTAHNAKAVKIKLTMKHCPCLTVAVELPSLTSHSRIVTHDIPVVIIPRKLWNDFAEPNVPDFDVSIYLPVLKTMKSVVERMKNLASQVWNQIHIENQFVFEVPLQNEWYLEEPQVFLHLETLPGEKLTFLTIIEANQNGEMNLKINTELVSVATHFKDLGNPPWIEEGTPAGFSQTRDPEKMAEATLDIKRLLQFLAGQQVNPSKAICNIVSKKVVHFVLLHEDVSLQYFIPAIA